MVFFSLIVDFVVKPTIVLPELHYLEFQLRRCGQFRFNQDSNKKSLNKREMLKFKIFQNN